MFLSAQPRFFLPCHYDSMSSMLSDKSRAISRGSIHHFSQNINDSKIELMTSTSTFVITIANTPVPFIAFPRSVPFANALRALNHPLCSQTD